MSSRATKAEALRQLKEQRQKKGLRSQLDDYEIKDDGDIFDTVDESRYRELVEKRREREDFVVDDDGLGYHDDGEEVVFQGDEHDFSKERRKRSGKTAALTEDVLRKARKTNALLKEKERKETAQTSSMWNFVKTGADIAAMKKNSNKEDDLHKPTVVTANLDSLLDDLDEDTNETPSRNRRRAKSARGSARSNSRSFRSTPVSARKRSYGRRAVHSTPRQNGSSRVRPPSSHRSRAHSRSQRKDDEDDFNDDFNDEPSFEVDQNDNIDVNLDQEMENAEEEKSTNAQSTPPKEDEKIPSPTESSADDRSHSQEDENAKTSESSVPTPAPNKRKRLAFRNNFATKKLSGPALAALEKQKQMKEKSIEKPKPVKAPATFHMNTNTNSIANEGDVPMTASAAAAAAADLESVLQTEIVKNETEGDSKADTKEESYKYVDMFWTDATESRGRILLFGKVKVPSTQKNAKSFNNKEAFVSCCAVVNNNSRNLFVLPKLSDDGETRVSMLDVHKEINSVLKPSCIPNADGSSWAGKPVKRKYAFGDADVPKEETDYLKVVYDAKYPTPSPEVCKGGEYYQHIFGAGASVLENFIIKRKLMGPCWIRIKNPCSSNLSLSWCKIEFHVEDPKDVKRLELIDASLDKPPPPVTTVAFKFKTVVNPTTHKSEIVSLSAICHKETLLDTASDESTKLMTQLSLIRPLGNSISADANIPQQFPRDFDAIKSQNMPQLQKMTNERAMLSRFFAQIGIWDPDVLVGHNAFGYDVDVLLNRCIDLKVPTWSKMGRMKNMKIPSRNNLKNKDWAVSDAVKGRILCDTYLSSKELVRETTYSLTNLAATQLKTQRFEIENEDVPLWFQTAQDIVKLAQHTLNDAQLVQGLMFKLQILPLTKQLTCIAGNLWSKTIKGNRADRNEYLLLHEFHQLKYIVPEKRREGKAEKTVKFSGGLVLEPKKGLYDSFILLLDFNSLYPSIIQEYNLCFTTVDWSNHLAKIVESSEEDKDSATNAILAPLPEESTKKGILPRVIKSLVERRRIVKKMVKQEKNKEKIKELDIRQKALKLTANSMYGCLGFSSSRFYAQPIAALVTAMGRETLQRTVDIAQETCGLEVIYGDTDSIMINTHKSSESDLSEVKSLGNQVKREVNKLYKTLELEIDGIFSSMLLLKKKKYAAVTVTENPDGTLVYEQEHKGLDLVRRDWCIQSKDTGHYVLDQILSQQDRETVVNNIHEHLENLAKTMREGKLPLEKFVITKGLSKHPKDYPDGKSLPHVVVAKMMLKNNRAVNTGDHIPYVITEESNDSDVTKTKSAAERARHPEEIERSAGALKPDINWYLTQQMLPPISRLCEPIAGTSRSIIAEKLGLDATKYNNIGSNQSLEEDEDLVNYTPASSLVDSERFKDVEKLLLTCSNCNEKNEFPGVFFVSNGTEKKLVSSGFNCVNPKCSKPHFWGERNHIECYARIANELVLMRRRQSQEYHRGIIKCDDPTCGLETRQLSVLGGICLARGCSGKMKPKYSDNHVHTQLKYLDSLFDVDHACEQLEKFHGLGSKKALMQGIAPLDKEAFGHLHELTQNFLQKSAYNWVSPSIWGTLFGSKEVTTLQ